jgi:anhydro-N-acetylmuramic acid kinase
VNIGGIANVTCLFAGAPIEETIAFDTGPGNCISDYLMRTHHPNGQGVDIDGALAAGGQVHRQLFDEVRSHPYFIPLGPKSTDGPEMIRIFEEALNKVGTEISLSDQLATACAITANQISRARSLFGGQMLAEIIVSGGGINNRAIMSFLRFFAGRFDSSEAFGVPSVAKEALAFAILGAATLDGVPSNVPSVTGARRAVVLGSITPKP